MFDLTGKTALVTGASGGIGGAIARALHAPGRDGRCWPARGADALDALPANWASAPMSLVADLSDPPAGDALVKEAEAALGQLDILVNNAGITRDDLALRMQGRGLAGGARGQSHRRRSG